MDITEKEFVVLMKACIDDVLKPYIADLVKAEIARRLNPPNTGQSEVPYNYKGIYEAL